MNNSFVMNLANLLMRNNPNIANNPRAQEMLSTIQNGDAKHGEEIARNLCASYGVTPQDAYSQATKFFHM